MGKNKKDKTPLLLKIVRWAYPKMEKIWPIVAYRYFTFIFFTPIAYPVPKHEKQAENEAEKFQVEVGSKKVQCYRWGSGERTVLFVHGWAGRATQFKSFIKPLLNEGFRVVGFDAPAHGKSTGKKTNILEFEQALQKIYKKVGKPDAVIAHSFGGSAVLFSAVNGLPVAKLINIACPTIGDEIIDTARRSINGSSKTREFFKKYIVRKYGRTFDEFTPMYNIKRVSVPIELLLVHDEDDREASIQQAIALQEVYPEAQLVRTRGLGHTRILRDNTIIRSCVAFIRDAESSVF